MEDIKNKYPLLLSLAIFFGLLGAMGATLDITPTSDSDNTTVEFVHVGVILDAGSLVGKNSLSCISMGISDFYSLHNQYKTRIVLHIIDSKGIPLQAVSGALNFMQDVRATALIIGSESSIEATLLAELGDKAKVPIISFSTSSPSPSPTRHPFLIKVAQDDVSQVKAIANITKACMWNNAILIYEDVDYLRETIPYLVDSLREVNTRIWYMSALLPSSSDDQIIEELQKLKTMQISVFVVNVVSLSLASKIFLTVKKLGMMSEGYAWIITDKTTNLLLSMNSSVIESMQGVVGLRPYIPTSKELHNFTTRWRKKLLAEQDIDIDALYLSVFGIWAYDAVWALGLATERVRNLDIVGLNSTDIAKTNRTSSLDGTLLLKEILHIGFTGLSGEIRFVKGNIIPKPFEVVNLVGRVDTKIGYWSQNGGLTKEIIYPNYEGISYSVSQGGLQKIIWPGLTTTTPRGLVVRKLKIGVPVKNGFTEFVEIKHDPHTNVTIASGFCIDVFRAAIKVLPYEVSCEFVPFVNTYEATTGSYNDLIEQVYFQNYDAVVGDTTIMANRSLYVDFTLPYTDLGVGMLVKNDQKSLWIFMEPLTSGLWLTSAAFFILTGIIVWIIEHPINNEFQGPRSEQIGIIFWFSFSTLVFAHRQNLRSNLSRFVVIVWLFLVLILTSSYTATLTSMLTLQQIKSISTGNYIGYQSGSFVQGVIISNLNFENYRLQPYKSLEDYAEALSKGSNHGGVSAIIDEIPYIKAFLAIYSSDYSMIRPNSSTNGFGFVFPKGSPLVSEFSRAITKLREEGKLIEIKNSSFKRRFTSVNSDNESTVLNLYRFRGLFIISGTSLTLALLIFMIPRFYENWHVIISYNFRNLIRRMVGMVYENWHVIRNYNFRNLIRRLLEHAQNRHA